MIRIISGFIIQFFGTTRMKIGFIKFASVIKELEASVTPTQIQCNNNLDQNVPVYFYPKYYFQLHFSQRIFLSMNHHLPKIIMLNFIQYHPPKPFYCTEKDGFKLLFIVEMSYIS